MYVRIRTKNNGLIKVLNKDDIYYSMGIVVYSSLNERLKNLFRILRSMGIMKFGYARVSKNNQNLELQIDALKKYGVDEIYEEKESSVKKNRHELSELLNKLRAGDTLVIWKLDRLGRTVRQLLQLTEDFEKNGIHFVSLTEGFDTTTPMGKFTFHMMCAVAQMERDIQIERTMSGLEAARKRGRTGGRKPKDQEKIDLALKMYYSNEYSNKEILEATGLSKTTLYKYIKFNDGKIKGVDSNGNE